MDLMANKTAVTKRGQTIPDEAKIKTSDMTYKMYQ